MSEDIPSGWERSTLGNVASLSNEKCQPSSTNVLRYIGLEHIESGSQRITGVGSSADVSSTKSAFRAGNVLYGKLRPYLKKVCRPTFDGICSTDILVFSESPSIDNGFLLYFLSRQETANFATQNANGINLPRINSTTLGELSIGIPPLAEQRRIVAKIEVSKERSRNAREALAEVGPLLEQFRQSLLAAAFRGDLTTDWRAANPNVEPASELLKRIRQERRQKWEQGELAKYEAKGKQPPKDWQDKYKAPEPVDDSDLPELPVGWCWTSFDECASEITVGFVGPMKHRYVSEGLTMLRSQNVRPLKFTKANCEFIPADFDAELAKSRLYGGEVLVVRSGVNVGDCCVYPKDEGIANCSDLVITRPLDNINASYAAMYIVSPAGRAALRLQRVGNAQPHFNVGSMKKSVLPLAPFTEQSKIVQILNHGIASVGELTETATAIFELTQLDQSILAKAFRGELVPQDPNDEPASVLLERIREDRERQQKKKSVTKTINKRPAMRQNVGEKLKEWLSNADEEPFTFDDLRRDISGDYDELKDAVYALLDQTTEVEQIFDESSGAMCFRRPVK